MRSRHACVYREITINLGVFPSIGRGLHMLMCPAPRSCWCGVPGPPSTHMQSTYRSRPDQVRSHASAARTIFSVSHVTHLLPLRATLPLHLVRKPARTSCCALSSLLTHRCTSGWAWAARNPRGTHAAEAGLHTRQRRCEVRASTDGMGLGGDLPTQGAYGAHAERMPCQSMCQSHRLKPKPSSLSSSSWWGYNQSVS